MNDFIGSLSFAQGMILVAVLVAIAVVFLTVIMLGFRGSKRKVKIGPVEIGAEGTEEPESPHSTCIHSKDIIMLLTDQAEMHHRITAIERRIYRDQTKYVKIALPKIKGIAQSAFLKALYEKIHDETAKDGLVDHQEFLRYVIILHELIDDCKEAFSVAFDENHFASRSEAEFRAYVEMQVRSMMQAATDYLNQTYRGKILSREALYDKNQSIVHEIETNLSEVFWQARTLAVEGAKEIVAHRAAFDSQLEAIGARRVKA